MLPATMRAWVYDQAGPARDVMRLEKLDLPEPASGGPGEDHHATVQQVAGSGQVGGAGQAEVVGRVGADLRLLGVGQV